MKYIGLFWICSTVYLTAFGARTLSSFTTEGPRPLHEALQNIEQYFATPLFYEEIPHENRADLVPGSEFGGNPNAFFLKSRKLNVQLSTNPNPQAAVADILSAYVSQGLPGTYSTISYHSVLAIIPNTMTSRAGSVARVNSLLQTPITIRSQVRTRIETLEAIFDALTIASKQKINYLPQKPDYKEISFAADNEAGGSVLSRLEDDLGPFACHIVYDPPTHEYYANIYWLAPAEPPGQTEQPPPTQESHHFVISK